MKWPHILYISPPPIWGGVHVKPKWRLCIQSIKDDTNAVFNLILKWPRKLYTGPEREHSFMPFTWPCNLSGLFHLVLKRFFSNFYRWHNRGFRFILKLVTHILFYNHWGNHTAYTWSFKRDILSNLNIWH